MSLYTTVKEGEKLMYLYTTVKEGEKLMYLYTTVKEGENVSVHYCEGRGKCIWTLSCERRGNEFQRVMSLAGRGGGGSVQIVVKASEHCSFALLLDVMLIHFSYFNKIKANKRKQKNDAVFIIKCRW